MKVSALNLAEFILTKYSDVNISPMKLQKLAYYAKVWSVVAGNDFIDATFEKWEYGPVNRAIFDRYRSFSKGIIPVPAGSDKKHIKPEQEDFVHFVLQHYIGQSAVALSMQTHREDPWIKTARNEIISEDSIRKYYSGQNFAKNFSRKHYKEGPFFVLKTNSWHSFTMDMASEEAELYESYPSYDEFIKRKENGKSAFDNFFNSIASKQ